MQPNELIAPGQVWLVGAGPGDPDLLTRKAERLIRAADIVFYDALVGAGVLALIPPHVERISVGKRSGCHSKAQDSINDLMLIAAQTGKRVVRLKGGDPSIFGRSAEEMAHLSQAGIVTHICPGITSASAAAASLGRSLTLRGVARKLTMVTAHVRAGEPLNLDWQALADPDATIAIYMGKAAAGEISRQLIAAGLRPDMPVALVENASCADQRSLITRLDLLPLVAMAGLGTGPAVILIGAAFASSAGGNPVNAMDAPSTREMVA